jgi:outer membrane protein assembly factor BamB
VGHRSSPLIYKDLVILQCDVQRESFIAAFRLKDGQEVWRTSREESLGGPRRR